MTFWVQGEIRAMVGITEVLFFFCLICIIGLVPNQHIKSLIGLGREYANATAQTV